ncbi:MAG: hypothetical protein QN141_13865 [Armatimonadota bacterium]|nr:hypothetical protein [Armatimonadota bacterium]MDR7468396.1 hypothetical protein [Armatimonadota bacterium]MDR7494987.1 hypothetical protein [Armatimonadota bacterium]MDR7548030.1 hypothetical protein [Armatimonadota bacterium]MDR7559565.1 hypothetical protein [Armatimonadota bacterium]
MGASRGKGVSTVEQSKERGQPIRCPMCGLQVANQTELEKHARTAHPKA